MTPEGKTIQRILIVEDELSYRTLLQRIFAKAGYHCTGCVDGEYAIEKLKKEHFDLLILDYILPGYNGLEIVRWLRERNDFTPAIIITAYPTNALIEECNAEKNVKFIRKAGFKPEEILTLASQLLVQTP
jgi:CheY-like chemotaxis protein